jgi:hypothetical protein
VTWRFETKQEDKRIGLWLSNPHLVVDQHDGIVAKSDGSPVDAAHWRLCAVHARP